MSTVLSPLSYIYDGRECLGFVLSRGRSGFEAFDRDEHSLGLHPTAPAAANAAPAEPESEAARQRRNMEGLQMLNDDHLTALAWAEHERWRRGR
jgi:hypothetical protein